MYNVRIYSKDISMEFGIEKCAMLIRKSAKQHMTEGMELLNQEKKIERSEKKRTNTWANWKLTPSNKWRWISQENEKATQKPNKTTVTL